MVENRFKAKSTKLVNDEATLQDDLRLFEGVRHGEAKALEALFEKYYERLCDFCYFFIESKEDSEEIVTDVFVEIWNKRNSLVVRKNLRAYFYTSVKHKAFSFIGAKKGKQDSFSDHQMLDLHDGQTPESEVLFNELAKEVDLFVNALPEPGRSVFRLCKMDGLPFKEIAQILNISEKTVENHLVLVLKNLRMVFKNG